MFVHTGDYVEHTSDDALRSTYYTFTPLPLQEGNFYTMDDDLAASLTETHRTLGILKGILHSLSDKGLFMDLMLFRESCFSKMIDSPDFDIHSTLSNCGLTKADGEIQNVVSAYLYAMDTDINKISHNAILQYALYGSGSKCRAMPRTQPMFLTQVITNYRQYNPTAPREIHSALFDISKYIETSKSDALIKAAMCHYQFEMIHPYECYNGIVGRILVYAILSGAGFDEVRYLNLSEWLYHRKAEYFEMLGLTQKGGRYSIWIDFFVRTIRESAQGSFEMAKTYEKITQNDEDRLAARQDRAHYTEKVYQYFKRNIVSTMTQASGQLQLSYNVVTRAVESLQSLGILAQITEGSRNRLFAHMGLMQLLLSE